MGRIFKTSSIISLDIESLKQDCVRLVRHGCDKYVSPFVFTIAGRTQSNEYWFWLSAIGLSAMLVAHGGCGMSIGLNGFWLLLVGLIIGWLIEWVIDWVYWRRRTVLRAEYDTLQGGVTKLTSERDTAVAMVDRRTKEVADLLQRLKVAQEAEQQQQIAVHAAKATIEQYQSDLSVTKRVVQQQQIDLTAAQEQIKRSEHTIGTLNNTIAALQSSNQQYQADLAQSQGIIEQHANLGAPVALDVQYQREIGGLQGKPIRDPLIDINGIGPVYQERLYAAEIYTFAQIAEQTPERLRQIVEAKAWQDIEADAWIAEAREFAKQVQEGTYGKGLR